MAHTLFMKIRCNSIQVDVFSNYVKINMLPRDTERPELRPSSGNLRDYSGSLLKVRGKISVSVKLEDNAHSCQANVTIFGGESPCLLGRNLTLKLELIGKKLAQIHKSSYSNKNLAKQFLDLLSECLGCLKDSLFSIEVHPTVVPKFCNVHTLYLLL